MGRPRNLRPQLRRDSLGGTTATVHRNPLLPILTPAQFRRRVRPYLPGTVLELRRLWPSARRHGYERGQRFVVGPYCSGCGVRFIWIFRPDGELDSTAYRAWLRKHFEILAES